MVIVQGEILTQITLLLFNNIAQRQGAELVDSVLENFKSSESESDPIIIIAQCQGAELVDSVLDVVRKESEGCDCLQV